MAVTFSAMRPPDAVEPDLDEEPILVRPYVRHLERQHATPAAEEPVGRPEDDGGPAMTPADIPPTRPAVRAAAPPVGRARRRFLAAGTGFVVLALGATVLALGAGRPHGAPAAGAATPRDSHLGTATAPGATAPDTPGTTGASPAAGNPARPGASPDPSFTDPSHAGPSNTGPSNTDPPDTGPPTVAPVLDAQPATSAPPGAGSRTGRITGASGLCLDGDGPDGRDKIRRWECNGTAGQTWTVADDGTVRALGRCLQAPGEQPRLQTCDGATAQRWRPGPAGSLVNQASGLCLGASDTADGRAPQRMAVCNQSDAQRWTLP